MIKIGSKLFMVIHFLLTSAILLNYIILSKYQKIMASLQFIFCWRKHIFLTIIQIFTKKTFSLYLRNLHFDHPYTKNMKKCWMNLDAKLMLHDVCFFEIDEKCWSQQKYHMKSGQTHNIWKQQHNRFPMWSIHSNQRSGSEVRAIQKFEIGRLTSAKNSGIPYETLPLFPSPPSPSPPPGTQNLRYC